MQRNRLTDLQLRIIAALQVDGRLPWRRIAEVFGEPERTVARYGNELLESGRVVIAALEHKKQEVIVACESAIGTERLSCEALARRDDVTYSYLTTGTPGVVAEIGYDDNLNELLTLELPATPGLQRITAYPVLKYFKTIRGWRCGALTQAEELALTPDTGSDITEWTVQDTRGPHDEEIMAALREDGRMSFERLARRVRMSESSVSRRIDYLQASGQFVVRALVEPKQVGYSVETLIWVQASPGGVEALGNQLKQWPEVRYAACLAGQYQLLINITATTHSALYALLSRPLWAEHAIQMHTNYLFDARKRGGRIVPLG